MTPGWGFRRLLRLPRTRDEIARDVDDEIAFHLHARVEELRQQGRSAHAARAAALREFGSVAAARRDLVSIDARRERSERRAAWGADLRTDLVHAVRALRRQRAFTAAVLLAFTLGIGATTVVFSILHGVLLRPLPVAEPERLVQATWGPRLPGAALGRGSGVGDVVVDAWRQRTDLFASVGWHSGPLSPILSGLGEARHVTGWSVSPGFFDTLGVRPALGRTFRVEEVYPASRVAIASHAFWLRDLGGTSEVLDRDITLDGEPVRIVGVMPRDMVFPVAVGYLGAGATDLWLPRPPAHLHPSGLAGPWTVIARLRDGVSPEAATEALDALTPSLDPSAARAAAEHASEAGGRAGAALAPIAESFQAGKRRPLLVLMAAVALVLLMACANAGNLLLARGVARQREIAVRAALGSGRWRIIRLVMTETLLLACAGGALGILAAHVVLPVVVALAGHQLPRGETIRVDGVVLAITVLACLVTGALAGIGPSLRVSRQLRVDALRDARIPTARGGCRDTSAGFLVAQVALSLMLLACTGLLLRSLGDAVREIGHGLDTGGITVARLSLPHSYGRDDLASFAQRFADDVQQRTGARQAAVSIGLPHEARVLGAVVEDGAPATTRPLRVANIPVTQGYFDVYGITLMRGSLLTDASPPDSAVISEATARALFQGDAVGRQIALRPLTFTVIGVVSDVPGIAREGGQKVVARPQEHVYIPFAAAPSRFYFTVSVAPAAGAAIPPESLRQAVREMDAGIAISGVYTLAEHVERRFAQADLYMRLLAALAIIALVIAAAGIYAVLAHGVAQRTPELGLRMVLGARPVQVLRVVVARALVLTALGAAVGCGLAVAAAGVIRANIFDVSPADPLVLGGAACGILLVALAAAGVPALRALRVDPAEVLRAH